MSSLSLEGTVYFFPAHLLLYNLINELISLWIDDIGDSDPLIQMYSGENWKKKIYENMSLNMQKYHIFIFTLFYGILTLILIWISIQHFSSQ